MSRDDLKVWLGLETAVGKILARRRGQVLERLTRDMNHWLIAFEFLSLLEG